MRRTLSTIGIVLVLSILAVTQSGCLLVAGAAAGVAGFAYSKGDLTGYVDADVQRAAGATKLAMNDLGFPILSSYADSTEGKIEARVGSDNKAVVHLVRRSDKVTKVNIRIGTFGDEHLSREILTKLESHLNDPGLMPSARVP